MAWVTQTFDDGDGFTVVLEDKSVSVLCWGEGVKIKPASSSEAHNKALMFRRAARRLEEIGKGLPNG